MEFSVVLPCRASHYDYTYENMPQQMTAQEFTAFAREIRVQSHRSVNHQPTYPRSINPKTCPRGQTVVAAGIDQNHEAMSIACHVVHCGSIATKPGENLLCDGGVDFRDTLLEPCVILW